MKKNLLFLIPMIIVAILLFLAQKTGVPAHIVIAVVGLVILIAYTVATKKSWKCAPLEILYRLCYAVALITGVMFMNVHGVAAIPVVHKISAALFAVLLLATEIHKTIKN